MVNKWWEYAEPGYNLRRDIEKRRKSKLLPFLTDMQTDTPAEGIPPDQPPSTWDQEEADAAAMREPFTPTGITATRGGGPPGTPAFNPSQQTSTPSPFLPHQLVWNPVPSNQEAPAAERGPLGPFYRSTLGGILSPDMTTEAQAAQPGWQQALNALPMVQGAGLTRGVGEVTKLATQTARNVAPEAAAKVGAALADERGGIRGVGKGVKSIQTGLDRTAFSTRPQLLKGAEQGIATDGYMAIFDKDLSKKLLDAEMKRLRDTAYRAATKRYPDNPNLAQAEMKIWDDRMAMGTFPLERFNQSVPQTTSAGWSELGKTVLDNGISSLWLGDGRGHYIAVDEGKYNFIRNKLPKVDNLGTGPHQGAGGSSSVHVGPLVFKEGDSTKALLMPLNIGGVPDEIVAKGEALAARQPIKPLPGQTSLPEAAPKGAPEVSPAVTEGAVSNPTVEAGVIDNLRVEIGRASDNYQRALAGGTGSEIVKTRDELAQLREAFGRHKSAPSAQASAPVPPVPVAEPPKPAQDAVPPTGTPPAPPTATVPPVKPPPPPLDALNRTVQLAQEQVKQDKPGAVSDLAQRIPGIRQMREWFRPGLKMTGTKEHILTAGVAETQARSEVGTRLFGTRQPAINELKAAFGDKAVSGKGLTNAPFVGTSEQAKSPLTGTLLDVAQNPDLYQLTDAQKNALSTLQQHTDAGLNYVTQGYGADIGKFPVKPGGAFLSNVDVGKDVVDYLGSESRAVASGRGKTRFYATARDRMAADPTFKPETDVNKLVEGMDGFKAKAASGEAFRTMVGGKTRLEVMQETHPELYKKMDALRSRLQRLKGYQGVLQDQQQAAVDAFLKSPVEGTDLSTLQSSLDVKLQPGRYVAKAQAGKDMATLQKELDGVRAQIRALKPAWEVANPKPYTFVQDGIYRYFPMDEAKLITDMRKAGNVPALNVLEAVRAGAFSGDFSPFTQQGQIGVLADPIGSMKTAVGGVKEAGKEGNFWHAVSMDALAKDVAAKSQDWSEFAGLMGMKVGGTPEEFATGFFGKIPGVNKLNAQSFVPVLRQSKSLYDRIWQDMVANGVSEATAKVVAADTAGKVFPHFNPARAGLSPARAALIRALPTSWSFIKQPTALIGEATKGMAKVAMFKPLTPQEKLAIKVVANIAASTAVVSVASHVMSADANKETPAEAAWNAINPDPKNGQRMTLRIGTRRYYIGGPYRAIAGALYPSEVSGVPVPVPFAGVPRYLASRLNPVVQTGIEEVRNKDFYGRTIRPDSTFPQEFAQGLWFALGGGLPLSAGAVSEDIRTGKGNQAATDFATQMAGINAADTTPKNQMARNTYGKDWTDLNPAEQGQVKQTPEWRDYVNSSQIPDSQVKAIEQQRLNYHDRYVANTKTYQDYKATGKGEPYTLENWRNNYYDINAELAGSREMRDALKGKYEGKIPDKQKEPDLWALNKYFQVMKGFQDTADKTHPNLPMTQDEKRAMMQAADDFLANETTPTQEKFVMDSIGTVEDDFSRQFRTDKRVIKDYWNFKDDWEKSTKNATGEELLRQYNLAVERKDYNRQRVLALNPNLKLYQRHKDEVFTAYRIQHPEIEAKLYEWGYVSTLRAPENWKKFKYPLDKQKYIKFQTMESPYGKKVPSGMK